MTDDRTTNDGGLSLTRRGWIVVGLTVSLLFLGGIWGDRTLNALVAPGVLALVAAVVVVHRADRPTVGRVLPPDDFPGESGTVAISVDANHAGTLTIRDDLPSGLSAEDDAVHEIADASATVTHDLHYDRRGAHEVGPVEVTVTDLLGLAHRTFEYPDETDTLLVYPEPIEPPGQVLASLSAVVELQRRPGRDEFDRLREYDRGDAPRDIHWKSSAKRPDDELVVKEFLGRTPSEGVHVAVGGTGAAPTIDALAEAAASVAIHLLEEGVEVSLETPAGTLDPSVGAHQRVAVLAMLARLTSGPVPGGAGAQIRILPQDGEATVAVGGSTVRFHEGDSGVPADREEGVPA